MLAPTDQAKNCVLSSMTDCELSFFTIAWGTVSALTSLVKNYPQIVVCRFILGLVEAPFFPGLWTIID